MHSDTKPSAIDSFRTDKVAKIVIKNSIPALIAMIMVMVYNLADTFFLGLTHDDMQVTAVSYATPLFMIFMSLGTLFGVGGTSVISRALGAENRELAKRASAFCFWACIAVGAVFMGVLWIFRERVIKMLGAGEDSLKLTRDYLTIIIGCGIFSMISNCFSSIVRTEGEAMKAMTGTLLGNLLNIILDPIFILVFRWGVVGAAVATVIGNAVAALYYILYFFRGKSVLSISPKHFSMKDGIFRDVLSVGISASLANLLVSLSSIVVNARLSNYDNHDLLVAGYGVTAKVIMVVTLIGIGVGSGVQPFFGYCYGAKEKKRLSQGIRFSALFALILCAAVSVLCYVFAEPIVKVFLTDRIAIDAGAHYTRILMSTAFLIGAFAICQNTLQAVGAAIPALLASLFRQGIIFIPAVFLMEAAIGLDGLIWAQPLADVLSLIVVIFMLRRRLSKAEPEDAAEPPKKRKKAGKIVLISILTIVLIAAIALGVCLLTSREAVQPIGNYRTAFPNTEITEEKDGSVALLPAQAQAGIIFYTGAQITPDAYIPLLGQLSEQGYAVFVPKLTCNMAAMSPKAAEEIIKSHPEISHWYLAGHSMGGLTASGYCADHLDEVDGLILLAAYTNRDLSGTALPMLSVYGDADGVLNRENYEKRRDMNSPDFEEHCIAGANHAQFGDYGKQPRDNDAAISADEQRQKTADLILDWLSRREAH